jgi:hypothetical protein
MMINAKDAVIWYNLETKQVLVPGQRARIIKKECK